MSLTVVLDASLFNTHAMVEERRGRARKASR